MNSVVFLLFAVVALWILLLSLSLVRRGSRPSVPHPRARVLVRTLGLGALIYCLWFVEVALGATPAAWLWAAALVWGIGLSVDFGRALRRVHAWALAVTFLVAAVALHLVDFSPRKPYARFYAAIETGMTPADVRSALTREFPASGRHRVPPMLVHEERLLLALDPEDARYNAETIDLTLKNGRVVAKNYSGD
jgi:hypothetical protein